MLTINSEIRPAQRYLAGVVRQMPFIISKALNDTAYAGQKAVTNMMKITFDRPTPYTLKAIVVDKSTKQNLAAWVRLNDDKPSKGTSWTDALSQHFVGGTRVKKKSEYALSRKGQFQGKTYLGISAAADTDAYGNLSRSQVVMLMSYFNSFKENGYRANATDRSRARRARYGKGGAVKIGPPTSPYKSINGVVYFMSRGKGWFVGQGKGWSGGRDQPLAAGIWAKTGTHGSNIKPVLLAIKQPTYRKLIDMRQIVSAVVKRDYQSNFNAAFSLAMRTAR